MAGAPGREPAEPASPHPFDLIMGALTRVAPPAPPAFSSSPSYGGGANGGSAGAPYGRGGQTAAAPPIRAAGASSGSSKVKLPGWPLKGKRRNFNPTPNRELAQRMLQRGPTVVVMGSRKGGVGKTSYAAAVAIVAGTVLDSVGHQAAILDANIANPDAWGQMNLPPRAGTVRDVVAALTANREPPDPVHAQTPALACYPEARETTEYSKTDVQRIAEYLKRRYTFIVVDMTNRLPDPLGGPEAAAAAYWLEQADVLVLPTTSAIQDFNGVLDYLEVPNLPPTVVPYIVPNQKANRNHVRTQQYLSHIAEQVVAIVEIPDEADQVRLAGMEGVPVEKVSATLRDAYRELTEVVVNAPRRARV